MSAEYDTWQHPKLDFVLDGIVQINTYTQNQMLISFVTVSVQYTH